MHADATYTLLEPLPTLSTQTPDLATYLGGVYVLTIGFAGILAVLMIIIGGIEYIFSAIPSAKSDAKRRITGAVGGLILALLSWIILNTINPALLQKGFNLTDVGQSASANVATANGGTPITTQSYCTKTSVKCFATQSDCTASTGDPSACVARTGAPAFAQEEWGTREELANAGYTINHPDSCGAADVNGVQYGCTNVAGFENTGMVGILAAFKQACDKAVFSSCSIVITGGTEMGHQTHGPDKRSVDLVDTNTYMNGLNDFLTGSESNPPSGTTAYKAGLYCKYEVEGDNGTATGAHWHCMAN
ncbi:MAG TPA: pilin [Candidatus Paceibacterota bacterium]|nr:pilin [Candidatus Paceibacterota bacterium]